MAPIFCFTCSAEKQLWLRHVYLSAHNAGLQSDVTVTTSAGHFVSEQAIDLRRWKGFHALLSWPRISPPFCRYFHFLMLLATGAIGMVSLKENCGALPCSEWSCSLNWMGICIVMEFKSPLSRFLVCFGMLCAGIFQLHPNVLHGEVGKPVWERLEDRLPP